MPPPSKSPSLQIIVFPRPILLVRLESSAKLPQSLHDLLQNPPNTGFLSITRTAEEISIATDSQGLLEYDHNVTHSKWKCFKIAGPLEHSILCDLITPLKMAKVPIFAISTWNTDYLLVPLEKALEAEQVLRQDGWDLRSDYDEALPSSV